jgi:hypothetical protein
MAFTRALISGIYRCSVLYMMSLIWAFGRDLRC